MTCTRLTAVAHQACSRRQAPTTKRARARPEAKKGNTVPRGKKESLNKRAGNIPEKGQDPTMIGVPIEAGEARKVDDIVRTACHIMQQVCMELASKLHTNCNAIIQVFTMTRSANSSTARKMTNGSFVGVGR